MDIRIKLDDRTDADIIRQLNAQGSVEEYLKRLIRVDIARMSGGSADLEKAEQSFDATLRLLRQVAKK